MTRKQLIAHMAAILFSNGATMEEAVRQAFLLCDEVDRQSDKR